MNDGRWEKDFDARIGKANTVLRELYCSVVTKWGHSNTAKLLAIRSFFVPKITYGHETSEMTERLLAQVQSEEMGIFPKGSRFGTSRHRCRSKQFLEVRRVFCPTFPKLSRKNFLRQTSSLQIFSSFWYIMFSSTTLP